MTNQVAIVTGAARPWGMGRATALGLARKGFDIVVADIREDWGGEAVEAIQAETGRRSVFISTDVSKKASAEALMRQTEASLGRIDVLANVAGVMVRERVEAITEEGADRIIGINLRGLILMCQAVIPAMKRVGGGRIINVSSGGALQPLKGTAVYSATKAGVIAFTKVLAWEVAPHNIVATTVAPGVVGTNMGGEEGPSEELFEQQLRGYPFGRPLRPEEVAEVIVYAATCPNYALAGQTLHANAGVYMV